MADHLNDTNVAIFLAPRGTEEVEFIDPKGAVEDAGASVDVVGVEEMVTSRDPDDLPAFCAKFVEEFEEGQY